MLSIKNLKELKKLYFYKSIGYTYLQQNTKMGLKTDTYIPNSIEELNTMMLNCYLCPLSKTRNSIVLGEGNLNAKLMFIGEAPGASEDLAGKPFVGQAGALLTKIIENVLELTRDDVYIANIVKCRPPNNRTPNIEEANLCKPFILKQIELIKPAVIVALGSTSFKYLTNDFDTPISKVRGEILNFGIAKLVPTFHPSFLLRTPSAKKLVYQDMLKIKGLL